MAASKLMRKGIPKSGAQVKIVGTARIPLIDGVSAPQQAHRNKHGFGHGLKAKAQARAGFDGVGPILTQPVSRQVGVPKKLRLNSRRSDYRQSVTGPPLQVQQ